MDEREELKIVRIDLQHHLAGLAKLLDISKSIFCTYDLKTNRFKTVNKAFTEILGLTQEEICSREIAEFIHPDDRASSYKQIEEVLKKGNEVSHFENRYRHISGEYRFLCWSAYPIIPENIIYAIAEDITSRKKQEQKLRFQSSLLDQIADRITATDLQGNITYVNRAECETFDKTKTELIGRNVSFFGDDASRGATQKEIIENTRKNGSWQGKVINFRNDGSAIVFYSRTKLLYDINKNPVGLVGISTDITREEEQSNELKVSELKFRTIFNQSAVGEIIVDINARIIDVNHTLSNLLGYTTEELKDKNISTIIYPKDKIIIKDKINELQHKNIDSYEVVVRFLHKEGHYIWCRHYGKVIVGLEARREFAIFALADISEIYETQKALKESEDLFRTIFTQSAVGISLVSPDGSYLKGNHKFSEITGYNHSELRKMHFKDITHPDDFSREILLLQQMLKGDIDGYTIEKRILHKSHKYIWITLYVNIVRDEKGKAKYWIASIIDINQRKQDEQKLKQLSDRLQLALKAANIGIWEYNYEKDVLQWDKRMHDIYGIKSEKNNLKYNDWSNLLHPQDKLRALDVADKAIREKEDYNDEFRIIRQDGNIRYLKANGIIQYKENGQPVKITGVNYDISAVKNFQKNLENTLEEKEILLRELYHRTKNNMQVICAMLDLEAIHHDDPDIEMVFSEMGQRIQTMSLVHHKLYQSQNLTKISLQDYISELIELLLHSNYRKDNPVKFTADMQQMEVPLDIAIPIGLILNELVTNSLKHAFTNSINGEISLKLSAAEQYFILTYSDNGKGLPENFNFKRDRNLGLLLIEKLVNQQLNGQFRFKSDNGLSFQIRINKNNFQ